MYTLKGVLQKKSEPIAVSDTFTKRDFVVEDQSGQSPNPIPVQLTQERCKLLNDFNDGDEIEIRFGLRGNYVEPNTEYPKGKNFVNIECYAITKV